jgi:hypothetical protein
MLRKLMIARFLSNDGQWNNNYWLFGIRARGSAD